MPAPVFIEKTDIEKRLEAATAIAKDTEIEPLVVVPRLLCMTRISDICLSAAESATRFVNAIVNAIDLIPCRELWREPKSIRYSTGFSA